MVDDREIAVPLPTLPGHPVSIREIQTQPHVREEDLALPEICSGTLRITKISPVREKQSYMETSYMLCINGVSVS